MALMAADLQCWNCDASLAELPRPLSRHMNCPQCFEDLHCCRMCRHFIDNATNPCADERADPPVHKEGANFCDFFRPANAAYRAGANERRERAKGHLAALFSGVSSASNAVDSSELGAESSETGTPLDTADENAQARRKLDELFR